MQATHKQMLKLVAKYQGWMEGDIARFPSPYLASEFTKAVARANSAARERAMDNYYREQSKQLKTFES